MTPTLTPNDDDTDKQWRSRQGSDEAEQLRQMTGIGADEERDMQSRAAEGAADDILGQNNDAASPKDINKAERTNSTIGDKPKQDSDDDNDEPEKTKKKGFWSKKKAAASGGIASLLLGGVFFGFSFVSGPAQVIQLGSILQSTHLQRQEDESSGRFIALARYLYNRSNNTVERTRLGYFGNKYVDRAHARIERQTGLKPVYDRGELKGFTYDDQFRDAGGNPTGSRGGTAYLTREGIPSELITTRDGRPFVTNEGLSDAQTRRLNRAINKMSGTRAVMTSINSMATAERFGLTRHPVKQAARKALATFEERLAEHKRQRAENIRRGDSSTLTTNRENTDSDGNGTADTDPDADGLQNEANDTLNDANEAREANAAGDGSGTRSLREKITGKLSAGLAAVVGIGCIARGIDQGAEAIKQDQVLYPMMRMSMEMVSLSSQMKSGQDVDLETVGFYASQLYDPETKTGVSDAQTYMESTGQSGGTDANETAKTATTFETPFHFLNDGGVLATAMGAVCGVLENGLVNLVLTIVGGPTAFIAGQIANLFIGPVLQQFTEWLAGDPINPDAKGAEYVNYMFYGGALVANQQYITSGGRELSDGELAQLQSDEAETQQADFQSKTVAQRVFDIYDNKSLIGSLAMKMNPNLSAGASNAAATIINPQTYLHTFSSLFSKKAGAASATSTYKYPFKSFGYSQAEMSNPKIANPYQNADDVVSKILPAHSNYIDRADKCFGVTISSDFTSVKPKTDVKPNPYSDDYKTNDCDDPSDDWLQTRMYINDSQIADSASCYEGDEGGACDNVGYGDAAAPAGTAGSPTGTATNGSIPTGSTIELAERLATNPNFQPQNASAYANFQKIRTTGHATQCGGPEIDARLLGVLLKMTESYKMYYNVFTDGHGCDGGKHTTGEAVDLVGANPIDGSGGGTGSFIHYDEWNQAQKTFYGRFYTDLGKVLSDSGGGALGQSDCADRYGVTYTRSPNVVYFPNDSCNHQHLDTRG